MSAETSQQSVRTSVSAPTTHARIPDRALPEWVDRLLGSDPGQTRLISALQAVATIAVAMAAELLFVNATHALQLDTHGAALPASQAALVSAQHHGVLVIAILLGAIMGLLASFSAAMFPSKREQLKAFVLMPIPMVLGLCIGLSLAPYRVLALASFVVVLAGGAYCRRFGPLGFVGGLLVFMGDFMGFFLSAQVHISQIGWLTAEIAVGIAVAVIAHFTIFYPSRKFAMRRIIQSYRVRARELVAAALEMLDTPDDRGRASRRVHRRIVRLNETALMIDAQFGHVGALPTGVSATALHQSLFDAELSLTNVVRFTERIADLDLPDELHDLIRGALEAVGRLDLMLAETKAEQVLRALRGGSTTGEAERELSLDAYGVLHRFAGSVQGFATAVRGWRASMLGHEFNDSSAAFEPSVTLMGGWLPGSAMVSAAASAEEGPAVRDPRRIWDRVGLAPYSRVAIQMGVAVTVAIILGNMLSERRFYWAVIAVFVTFMGANNASEQLRKGAYRVVGTVVGVVLGAVIAHLVGNNTDVAIGVILVALFFGLYLMRISYAFMVIGITIMVSQMYVQLDEYSDSLLLTRLEETGIGAAVAVLTVLCVVPLRTGRVARVATRQYVEALGELTERSVAVLLGTDTDKELRNAARRVDLSYQSLVTTLAPMGFPFNNYGQASADNRKLLQCTSASRHYARNLVLDTEASNALPAGVRDALAAAGHQLNANMNELVAGLQNHDEDERMYVRSASMFDLVAIDLDEVDIVAPSLMALSDLQLVDGAMASLAQLARVPVYALDTR